jgi:two-component system NtrC family sensor kinase
MKLQTKFNLGIITIFAILAVIIAVMSINYVNANTIREAENRVRIYMRAAWEIHSGKVTPVRSTAESLTQSQSLRELLQNPKDEQLLASIREELESVRQEKKLDILNVLAPDGTVILRTRFPYNDGDNLSDDPMVERVISTQQSSSGNVILLLERLDIEGPGLVERSLAISEDPRGMLTGVAMPVVEDGRLLGIIQMGHLLNGSTEEVDRIRDTVFANEYYKGKPVGTATIFMDDLRISTNVLDNQGRRAVGTRVSREVAEHVLEKGFSWTGRAFVVDTWYLSQYDPIKDPAGNIIGMLYVGELEQKYLDLRTRAVVLNLSVILIGMVVAFLMSFFVVRSILGPIRKLIEATRCLSNRDLTHRVVVNGNGEIAYLSASFNQMAEQLETQHREIEQSHQELEGLNNELKVTNRNYMEMLGFVSHELKNALTSAIMSLYTVKDGYLGEINPSQKKSLQSVAESLDYFQDMIKNYLDLSRLEKGELIINKSQVSLHSRVILPVLEGLQRELQEKQMLVNNRIPENLVLNADGDLLKIVYSNLLSNAVKYGRSGGQIVVDARENGHHVRLSVCNDSEGISSESMSILFKKFSRLDNAEYAGKRGTGLGLYICKQIVEKHQGEIWVDSQMGAWVKFSFSLPKI